MNRVILFMFLGLFSAKSHAENLYDFSFKELGGGEINMENYKGKVVMVVNTASHCGFTPQYEELQQLYNKYQSAGLEIIATPSLDFGSQEFDNEKDIRKFIQDKYQVTFPVAAVTKVKGDKAHPFYKWVKNKESFLGNVKWNFHKYVFDKKGEFVGSFGSMTSPMSKKVIGSIGTLLDEE